MIEFRTSFAGLRGSSLRFPPKQQSLRYPGKTSSAFRGWVWVLGYGFGVRGRKVLSDVVRPSIRSESLRFKTVGGCTRRTRKVKSRDCALASDLVRAAGGCAPRTSLRTPGTSQPGSKLTGDACLEFLEISEMREH